MWSTSIAIRPINSVQRLLRAHAMLTALGCSGLQMMETPLIRAAHNGHFQMVKFLVENRADVNAIDLVWCWAFLMAMALNM